MDARDFSTLSLLAFHATVFKSFRESISNSHPRPSVSVELLQIAFCKFTAL